MNLNEVSIGLYLAENKKNGEKAMLLVWGIYPFMQAYIMPAELGTRPQFHDADISDWDFLERVPEATDLLAVVKAARK